MISVLSGYDETAQSRSRWRSASGAAGGSIVVMAPPCAWAYGAGGGRGPLYGGGRGPLYSSKQTLYTVIGDRCVVSPASAVLYPGQVHCSVSAIRLRGPRPGNEPVSQCESGLRRA